MSTTELREQHAHHVQAGKTILARAKMAGRDLTQFETSEAERHIREARTLTEQICRTNGDRAVTEAINGLTHGAPATKNSSAWAKNAAGALASTAASVGSKAVVAGSYETGQMLSTDIDRIPEYPTRLLDLLVNRRPVEANTFAFLRQNARHHNAAAVADGAEKPVSVYSFEDVEDRVRVLAHLSEDIPLRILDDIAEITTFLEDEMEGGLLREIERQVISGAGTGEDMAGLLSISGVLAQPWDASGLLGTLRRASTALEVSGETPTAWVINPADVQTMDLLTDGFERSFFGGPSTQLAQSAPVWGTPVVRSIAVPAGTAVLGNWSKLQLIVREDVKIDIDLAHGFSTNTARFRAEGRFGVAVVRPSSFVIVDTTAA